MASRPRVLTIPSSAPFLDTLIRALLDGRLVPGFAPGRDPLALASATLYLPTRRAGRLARDLFLEIIDGDAAILPRIVPIGDVDEDEIAFAEQATGDLAAAALDLPPSLGTLERKLLLAELVLKWAQALAPQQAGEAPLVANTPAAALALADDLARLIDDMVTRRVDWARLDGLVPDHLDEYWQLTLKFLRIARHVWPEILKERGAIEAAARRDILIAAEAERLIAQQDGPVIAAGSTGSVPATAELIAAIARCPQGAVVLPGLDTDLDADTWRSIAGARDPGGRTLVSPAYGHPQFAMQGLLTRIGIAREEVQTLGAPASFGREMLLSEALRPAAATEVWQARVSDPVFAKQADAGLAAVTVIEAAHAEEEALAIAVALRETVATPGKTAALITPDRALARRVLADLERWNVPVDDSGGDPLPDTAAGRFARLAAEAAVGGLAPVPLLALLKHPLLRLGSKPGGHARAIATLEMALLRGPRPKAGSAGLAHALQTFRDEQSQLHRRDPRAGLAEIDLDSAADLIGRLSVALAPLESLPNAPHRLAEFAARHCDVVATLGCDHEDETPAFAGPDGRALSAALDELAASAPAGQLAVAPGDYPELFQAAIFDRVVRRPGAAGVRVRILGPLEARLALHDRIVLGGLNEGTWPPETATDAWLSRPMRQDLGLDLPERRIGLNAHDFAQGMGAPEVFLTRAAKVAGAPTVASRFVQRLAAVGGKARWDIVRQRGADYVAWSRTLDRPLKDERIKPPAPKPPLEARPRMLSVTEIENWLRDPYTIYARHILKLAPLDPVDLPPGGRDRGIVIHGALGEFTQTFAKGLPSDPAAELIRIGARHFAPLDDYPEARAFWWPRFRRIAVWFAGFEARRRADVRMLDAEIGGRIPINSTGGIFTLSARADRIELRTDGRYAIVDYKTGQVPTEKQVRTGLSPQMTLESAILRQGGFKTIPAGASVGELLYIALKGGEPAGEEASIVFKDGTPDSQADIALAKLATLVTRFDNAEQPYRSLVLSMWRTRYGNYDHLARVKEWSLSGGEPGGEE